MPSNPKFHSSEPTATLSILVSGGAPTQLPGFGDDRVDVSGLFGAYPAMKKDWMPSAGLFPYKSARADGGIAALIDFSQA